MHGLPLTITASSTDGLRVGGVVFVSRGREKWGYEEDVVCIRQVTKE